jgi:hypothetical protein
MDEVLRHALVLEDPEELSAAEEYPIEEIFDVEESPAGVN